MRRTTATATLLLTLAVGCGDDGAPPLVDEAASTGEASTSGDPADSEGDESSTAEGDESSTTGPAECGDGVVEGDEMCDGGDDCDDRCRVPGEVAWTWEAGTLIRDLATIDRKVAVCAEDGLMLFDVDDGLAETLETGAEQCVRVAAGADRFAAVTTEDDFFSDFASLRAYDDEGEALWTAAGLPYDNHVFARPAVAVGPSGGVVTSIVSGQFGRLERVSRYNPNGGQHWTTNVAAEADAAEVGAIAVASNGGVAVAGGAAQHGLYLGVLDDQGNTLFGMREVFGDMVDRAYEVTLLPDGRIAAVGAFSPSAWVGVFEPPATDFTWVVELSQESQDSDLVLHPSGNLIALHGVEGGMALSAFDADGSPLWSTTLPELLSLWGEPSLAVLPDGDLVAAFDSSSAGLLIGIASPPL